MGYLLRHQNTTKVIPRRPTPCRANPITDILNCNSWKDKRCFILCGGPSLEGFDFEQIRNEYTIGINKSFATFNTTICYCMDQRFFDQVTFPNRLDSKSIELHNKWSQYPGIKVFLKHDEKAKFTESVYYVSRVGRQFISFDISQGIYAGNNSGFGGMMLAIALGCRKIYLLGADLKIDEKKKKTHFHDGYNQPMDRVKKVLESFKKEFEYSAPDIEKAGVEVVNLNPNSALSCFPKKTLKEVL